MRDLWCKAQTKEEEERRKKEITAERSEGVGRLYAHDGS
jgi:hypothetical protein